MPVASPRALLTAGAAALALILSLALQALLAAPAHAATCTRTWDGGAGTFAWFHAANWSPDGLPGSGDDVCIDAPSTTVQYLSTGFTTVRSITAQTPLAVAGGTLTLTAASQLNGGLHLSAGILVANGPLTIAGASSWTGGQLSGVGDIVHIGAMTLSGSATKTLKSTVGHPDTYLKNAGTITQTGTGALLMHDGRIMNLAGALYDLQSSNGPTTPVISKSEAFTDHGFENYGTFRRSVDAGTAFVTAAFGNHGGTIDARTGTLDVGLFGSGGAIEVASGALIRVPAAATWSGTWTGSGPGLVKFDLGGQLGFMPISAGGATFSFPFEFASGRIVPLGPWTITGTMLWTGGTIGNETTTTPQARVNLTSTATLTVAGPTNKFLKGGFASPSLQLNNAGTILHTGTGSIDFRYAILNNLAGALYRLDGDGGLTCFEGDHLVNNSGTFRKAQGASSHFGVFFNNTGGTLAADTGTLTLGGGAAGTGGTLEAAAGATLNLATGGNWTGTTGGHVAGTVRFSGGINVPTGSTATFSFTGNGFELAGGLSRLNGTLTNAGLGSWTAGEIRGVGGLVNQGTLTISGAGGNKLLRSDAPTDALVNNYATVNHTSGALGLYYGRIYNHPGAVYDMSGTAEVYRHDFGGHAFFNYGTLLASAGTPKLSVQLDNGAGTVDVRAGANFTPGGISQISGGAINGGRYVVAGTLTFCCGPLTRNAGAVILDGPASQFPALNPLNTNTGTFELRNGRHFTTPGALANSGTLLLGPASRLTVGDGADTFSQTASGTLSLALAGPTPGVSHAQLAVRGPVSLGGTLALDTSTGYTPAASDTLILVDNDLTDPIAGTFAGLPEGALVTVGAAQRPITYVGGTGNDVTFAADTTPPPAPTITSGPAEGSLSSSSTATLSFTSSEPGATFQCSLDGSPFTACESPVTYTAVASGLHTFAVRAVDAAGNTSPLTTRTWTVDTTPPPAPTIDSGPAAGATTNQSTATFAFSNSEPGTTFECSVDGAPFTPCTSPVTLTGLADGAHTFAVRSRDAAGNVGPATTRSWTTDTIAPAAPTISGDPAAGTITNQTSATFQLAAEPGATLLCSLDGAAFAPCGASATYSNLSDGPHTLAVQARDAAGNLSPVVTRTWIVDATPPAAPTITSGPAQGSSTTDTAATFAFTGESGATIQCSLDGSPFTACTSPTGYSSLAVGSHTFQVRATDAPGNVGPTASRTWTVAPPAPVNLTCTATASPSSIWPPTHRLIDVKTTVTLSAGASGFRLVSVTSNEPDNGLGDGDQAGDIQLWSLGTPDTAGQLRAERSGAGSGRLYTLTYAALDSAGNPAGHCTTTVAVPRDNGGSPR